MIFFVSLKQLPLAHLKMCKSCAISPALATNTAFHVEKFQKNNTTCVYRLPGRLQQLEIILFNLLELTQIDYLYMFMVCLDILSANKF